jgi:hypothetical protein
MVATLGAGTDNLAIDIRSVVLGDVAGTSTAVGNLLFGHCFYANCVECENAVCSDKVGGQRGLPESWVFVSTAVIHKLYTDGWESVRITMKRARAGRWTSPGSYTRHSYRNGVPKDNGNSFFQQLLPTSSNH